MQILKWLILKDLGLKIELPGFCRERERRMETPPFLGRKGKKWPVCGKWPFSLVHRTCVLLVHAFQKVTLAREQ